MFDQTHSQNFHLEEHHQNLNKNDGQVTQTHQIQQQYGQGGHQEQQSNLESNSKVRVLSKKQQPTHNQIEKEVKHDQFKQQTHPLKKQKDVTLQVPNREIHSLESSAGDSQYEVIDGTETITDIENSKNSSNRLAKEQVVMSEKVQPTQIIKRPRRFSQYDVHVQNDKHGEDGHKEQQSIQQSNSRVSVLSKKLLKHPLKKSKKVTFQVPPGEIRSLESSAGDSLDSKFEVINGTETIADFEDSKNSSNRLAKDEDVTIDLDEEEKKTTEITQSQDVCNLLKLKPTSEVQQSLENISEQKIKEEITNSPERPSQPEVDIKQIDTERFEATFEESNMLKNDGNEQIHKGQDNEAINVYVDALRLCHPIYLMAIEQVEPQENQVEVPNLLPNVSTKSNFQKQQNVNVNFSAFASTAVISTAVTTLLSTLIRKYLLKEEALSANSLASTGIISGGVFGLALSKKIWKKLAFGAASSGAMALLLLVKSRAQ